MAPSADSDPQVGSRLDAGSRMDGQVSPLELFFDLVFVLALTQCTALMADVPTAQGVAQALLIMSSLWWSWVGFAWLTSIADPEVAVVRVLVFVAMAAFLVAALSVPGAFGSAALTFALAYAVVRAAHITLFVLASRGDPVLRRAVVALSGSTLVSTSLLLAAAGADDTTQAALWGTALLVDFGGWLLSDTDGWRLVPEHFSERHGLVLIIALGESVVAIGAGAEIGRAGMVTAQVLVAGVVCVVLVVALWWLYFDVAALGAAQQLERVEPTERNRMARDAYSFLHLPMIAGIVLIAFGLRKSLGAITDPLATVPAAALLGGTAVYLLAHLGFRLRTVRSLSWQRLLVAVVLLALVPVAREVAALHSVGGVAALLVGLIVYETVRFRPHRDRLRSDAFGT